MNFTEQRKLKKSVRELPDKELLSHQIATMGKMLSWNIDETKYYKKIFKIILKEVHRRNKEHGSKDWQEIAWDSK